MVVEVLGLFAIATGGAALAHILGIRGWGVAPLGFILGVVVYIGIGIALLASPFPSSPAVGLAATMILPCVAWGVFARRRGWRPALAFGALVAVVLVGLAAAVRTVPLFKWHTDSVEYVNAAELLAHDRYFDAASPYLLIKRLFAVAWLQSPGQLQGEPLFHAVLPAFALAVVGTLAWLVAQAGTRATAPLVTVIASVGAAGWLLSTNRFVFHAFYVNGHLLLGGLLLLAAGACFLIASGRGTASSETFAWVAAVAVFGTASIRPEAPLLAALVIGPFLISGGVPLRLRAVVGGGLMMGVLTWNAWVAYALVAQGYSPLGIVTQVGVLVGVPLALGFPRWKGLGKAPERLVAVLEWAAFPAVAALWFLEPEVVERSVRAFLVNAFGSGAYWGSGMWVLAVTFVVAVTLFTLRHSSMLRFYAVVFVPVALALAVARDGAYRIGPYDSLARMLMQWFPVVVLFIVLTFAYGDLRPWARSWGRRLSRKDTT